ncbi:hypothetical protein QJS04_geneDACA007448 [Acorus gramineus]|uniref:Uncharacterized protein n=1 Tax=Acorus gramineus TaxID=55184 RepID=A0AAV9B798_ACOGR|nr:hypothetical protein QJS04_geneDACA007448 [Acorus gramineus]
MEIVTRKEIAGLECKVECEREFAWSIMPNVSSVGVTGARSSVSSRIQSLLQDIKEYSADANDENTLAFKSPWE